MAAFEQGRVLARPWEETSFMSPLRPVGQRLGSCAVTQWAVVLQAAPTFTECPWTEDVSERESVGHACSWANECMC